MHTYTHMRKEKSDLLCPNFSVHDVVYFIFNLT